MGCAGRSGCSAAGAHAAAWVPGAAVTVGSWADALGWEAVASLPPCRLTVWVGAADQEQGQAQVADLGQQAVQGRRVDDRPGDDGLAGLVAADVQALEPGRPAVV
jgi:hypothetical protein